jgi:hypothetical protein
MIPNVCSYVWGPNGTVLTRTAFVLATGGGQAYVMWCLRFLLNRRFGFRGADPYLQLLIGLYVADMVVAGRLILTGAKVFHNFPGGVFGIQIAYGLVRPLALGTLLIALGLALLRMISHVKHLLQPYAYLQVATGVALATMALDGWAFLPLIPAQVLLGVTLLGAAHAGRMQASAEVGKLVRADSRAGWERFWNDWQLTIALLSIVLVIAFLAAWLG